MRRYLLKFFALSAILAAIPITISHIGKVTAAAWALIFIILTCSIIAYLYYLSRKRNMEERAIYFLLCSQHIEEAKSTNDQDAVRYFSLLRRIEELDRFERLIKGNGHGLKKSIHENYETSKEMIEKIKWAVAYEARSDHAFIAATGKIFTTVSNNLKENLREVEALISDHENELVKDMEADVESERRKFDVERKKNYVKDASIKLSGLAGAISAKDAHINQGLGAINKILIELIELDSAYLRSEHLQSSIRMLLRKMTEEEITHEPIESSAASIIKAGNLN